MTGEEAGGGRIDPGEVHRHGGRTGRHTRRQVDHHLSSRRQPTTWHLAGVEHAHRRERLVLAGRAAGDRQRSVGPGALPHGQASGDVLRHQGRAPPIARCVGQVDRVPRQRHGVRRLRRRPVPHLQVRALRRDQVERPVVGVGLRLQRVEPGDLAPPHHGVGAGCVEHVTDRVGVAGETRLAEADVVVAEVHDEVRGVPALGPPPGEPVRHREAAPARLEVAGGVPEPCPEPDRSPPLRGELRGQRRLDRRADEHGVADHRDRAERSGRVELERLLAAGGAARRASVSSVPPRALRPAPPPAAAHERTRGAGRTGVEGSHGEDSRGDGGRSVGWRRHEPPPDGPPTRARRHPCRVGARGPAVPRRDRRLRRRLRGRVGVLHAVGVPDHEPADRRARRHPPHRRVRVLRAAGEAAAAGEPAVHRGDRRAVGHDRSVRRCREPAARPARRPVPGGELGVPRRRRLVPATVRRRGRAGVAARALLVARDRGAVLLGVAARVRRHRPHRPHPPRPHDRGGSDHRACSRRWRP